MLVINMNLEVKYLNNLLQEIINTKEPDKSAVHKDPKAWEPHGHRPGISNLRWDSLVIYSIK